MDINGGAIDGTAIGATTPSTIAGTTVSASSGFTGNLTGDVTGAVTGNVSGNITSTGTSSFSSIDVNGGSIDGATIGSTSAAAITGTTITANSGFEGNITSTGTSEFTTIDVNGGTIDNATIGGATPAVITGTTITANSGFSGNLTGNVTGTVSSLGNHDTDDLAEGATNLYYTDTRADARITAAIGSTVQAHSSVLDATTASYTTAEETKLSQIEALADVTDTTNVVAALTAGTNISIDGDGTISATDTNTTYTAGDGLSLTGTDFDVDLSDPTIFSDTGVSSRAVKTDANGEIQDGKGDVRDIPSSSNATGTLEAADAGKFVPITADIAIPASTFGAGEAVTIYNNSTSEKDITSATGVTAYLAGTATTGTRTLAQRGLATLLCVGTNTFVISGVGLT